MNLSGKVALVTGGAHRVGKAITLALAQQGAQIVLHYGTSAQAAQDTAQEIEALGGRAVPIQADLRDPAQIERLFQAAAKAFGRLDVLVNSAANFKRQRLDAAQVSDWADVMQANLRAPFFCTQQAARLMRQTDRPADQPAAIINIADLSGIQAWPGYALHGLSKAGLIHLTKTSAVELAPDIRVNAIAPGAILPPQGTDENSAFWQNIRQRVPLRRTGHPDLIGQTVVFLAQNDYITGALIPVDGGEHLVGPVK
ncbi:MAG: SDR family oxidoreductase [Chloroflexi bacterium]|nr:SDR family oxidoreductase [Chloroflexota bacterium]